MSLRTNVGAPDSNSFITLSEAEDYFEALGVDTTSWDDLEDSEQELRLVLAAEAIGTSLPLRGFKAYANQALSFPRAVLQRNYTSGTYRNFNYGSLVLQNSNVAVPLGNTSFTEIPEDVKQAQAYIAYYVIHKNIANRQETSDTDMQPPSTLTVSSFSVRGISVSFNDRTTGDSYLQAMDQLVSDSNSVLYLLISKYLSQVRFTQGGDRPTPLVYDESQDPPQPDDDSLDGGSFTR